MSGAGCRRSQTHVSLSVATPVPWPCAALTFLAVSSAVPTLFSAVLASRSAVCSGARDRSTVGPWPDSQRRHVLECCYEEEAKHHSDAQPGGHRHQVRASGSGMQVPSCGMGVGVGSVGPPAVRPCHCTTAAAAVCRWAAWRAPMLAGVRALPMQG